MELPLLSYANSASFSRTGLCSSSSSSSSSIDFSERRLNLRRRFNGGENSRNVKASAGRSSEGIEKTDGGRGRFAGPATMEVTTLDRGFSNSTTVDFPIWDQIGAVIRLTYGIGGWENPLMGWTCTSNGAESSWQLCGDMRLRMDALFKLKEHAV